MNRNTTANGSQKPGTSAGVTLRDHARLGFSISEYRRRYDLVLELMRMEKLDVLLVRSPENITYISGYETPGYYKYHCLIISPGMEPTFVIRRFEELNISEYSWLTKPVPVDDWENPPAVTARTLRTLGIDDKTIGVEKAGWFYTVHEHELLASKMPSAHLVDATRVVWEARIRKSNEEISMMRRSAVILDKAMQAGIDASLPGITDDHVNAEVNRIIFENGGEYMGLPPFVLSGERSSLPHQTARSEVIKDRDLVYFEISVSKWRYAAALMRTIFIGEPTEKQRRCAEACIEAVNVAMSIIRPGVSADEVNRRAREPVEKAGFGEYWRHRLGYSIGVNYPPDWGEGEIISLRKGENRLVEAGMTFHMVPLCLVYREFGIGFSETVHVTPTGSERFSMLPRNIIIK